LSKRLLLILETFLLVLLYSYNCKDNPSRSKNNQKDTTIYITDRTGKKWDITHAVKEYNFKKDNFNYGLGPNAIQPINYPDMLIPDDPQYPDSNSRQRVIGININGEIRAYPVDVLSSHEVVNDTLKGFYTAVAY